MNVVAGGIKERGLAEQAYESLYAYLASDIAAALRPGVRLAVGGGTRGASQQH